MKMAANRGRFRSFISVIVCIAGFAYVGVCPPADLNGDCRVNFKDVAIFAQQWLSGGGAISFLLAQTALAEPNI
jgi:hypothetical protein